MARAGTREKKRQHFFDYSLLFIVLFLVGLGLVVLYSTSSYEATQTFGSSTYYLYKQIRSVAVGFVLMIALALIPYRIWSRFYWAGYLVSAVLLILIIPFGHGANGAKRWFRIGGMSVQPAEIVKVAIILFMAVVICMVGSKLKMWRFFFALLLLPAPLFLMIWKITDNMSSAIIVYGIAFLMMFAASSDYKQYLLITVAGIAAAAGYVLYAINSAGGDSLDFRGRRVLAWLHPEQYSDSIAYQTLQALYAIGSGGVLGKGLGQSMQKMGFIPEAQNDMIFSIICEELGIVGAVFIIILFVVLLWRMMVIANNAKDLFGSLLVVGVMSHLGLQVVLNIAVVTAVIPNTGVSLPFISYGGTAIMMQLAEVGLVMSVARGIELKDGTEKKPQRERERAVS